MVISLALVGASIGSCRKGPSDARETAAEKEPAPVEEPLEVRTVPVPGDEPAFVLSGPEGACPRIVFLHGMCSHGLGYIQSFQQAGRDHGGVLGLSGDIDCGGSNRKYVPDPVAANERVERALLAIEGPEGPCAAGSDLVIVGYSQGAYLAEKLAARFPERYTRLVLIGAPTTPSPANLERARGVVNISGELDATYRMKEGTKALTDAGVPSIYLEMPGARHGEMRDAEALMGEAFDWLDTHARGPLPRR
ncbi:Hypothetical protein A7982_00996 [Minicystis rosea]|nr:Hypothetical protein A7982_00996 [Minicystis rosea]